MKRFACFAVALVVLVMLLNGGYVDFRAWADDVEPEVDGPIAIADQRVPETAVINVGRVFKESADFTAQLGEIKNDVDKFDREFKQKQQRLMALAQELQRLKNGSKDYVDLQQQIVLEESKIKTEAARRKADFLRREAVLYATFYAELTDVVADYARNRGIRLVVRIQEDTIDHDNNQSVLNALNRTVVFHDRIDITDDILTILEGE